MPPEDLSWWKEASFLDSHEVRLEIASTLRGFCLVYLPHYFHLEPADFYPQLLDYLEDPLERFLAIEGFRGSAKSTGGSLALPLFGSLVQPERYPFIIPCADTGMQAALNIANIKQELEHNALLRQDFGQVKFDRFNEPIPEPTLESEEEWQAKNMLLASGVRMLARSRGQKIRGLRHRQFRPSLLIVDDPEDLEWVRTKENRDKTERWLMGEAIPAIDEKAGRCIVIGNRLGNDALMARLSKNKRFRYLRYSLIDEKGNITWKAQYPDQAALDAKQALVGLHAFMREYLLKVIPEEGAVIKPEWIRYHDGLETEKVRRGEDGQDVRTDGLHATAVDLAISKRETADYTSMVSAVSFRKDGMPKIQVKPFPVNARLSFHETIETAKSLVTSGSTSLLFVEDVAYQRAAVEEMERAMLPVIPVRPTTDKRARLQAIAPYIQNGTVEFAREGNEDLLIQLLGFGVEQHDDLVDALVNVIQGLVQQGLEEMKVFSLDSVDDD